MVKPSLQSGVTMIEMLVVVGIIAFVSSVMIFNYSDFSTNVSLRNLSQEVALSIRKAQTYATSVRPIEGLDGLTSRAFGSYGISFSLRSAPSTDPKVPSEKNFVLFVDIPEVLGDRGAGTYGQESTGEPCGNPQTHESECIETFSITTADKVVGICSDSTGEYTAEYDCPPKGGVDITFTRPNPDARIMYFNNGSNSWELSSYAKIVFESAKGLRRSVTVWNTGQISVQ
ncbi:MAG: prepilin-type N-terminal cleavage/methylation domain-containing protein [Candidatus Pacebacteria bacterium]|nr:prepilin-type N-terminal cleavage/methylation domain-containing protein [Candidatus Paceibacterota bacterium]